MPSPNPKPMETKLLQGTARKDRQPDSPALPNYTPPKPPTFLNESERKYWDAFARVLDEMGVLANSDQMALAMLAQHYAEWQRLQGDVRKEGYTITLKKKDGDIVRINPKWQVCSDLEKKVLRLIDRFGLTPSARGTVGGGRVRPGDDALPGGDDDTPKPANEFDEIMNFFEPKK